MVFDLVLNEGKKLAFLPAYRQKGFPNTCILIYRFLAFLITESRIVIYRLQHLSEAPVARIVALNQMHVLSRLIILQD